MPSIKNSNNNPKSREQDIVIQELKGEILIYDLKIDKAFCLNETAALVWQLCDGTNSVGEISQTISRKLRTPVTNDLVWLALDELKKENLLDNNFEPENLFKGLSRREVIRRVGLASLIALPVISFLTAPTMAMAQSNKACRAGISACSVAADCPPQANLTAKCVSGCCSYGRP